MVSISMLNKQREHINMFWLLVGGERAVHKPLTMVLIESPENLSWDSPSEMKVSLADDDPKSWNGALDNHNTMLSSMFKDWKWCCLRKMPLNSG